MGRFTEKIVLNTIVILIVSVLCVIFLVIDSEAEVFGEDSKKFIYTHDNRPDPFLPLLSSKGLVQETGSDINEEMMRRVSRIKVTGILWDEEMPIVMINNKMRKEGDIVESLTIKTININGIILGFHDLTHEILLIKKKKMYDQGGIQ